jgi:arylsulfatase A-like enzyme
MVESMDAAVGRIVEAVRKNGLAEKTLIVFTSDNGGFDMVSSNQPLRGAKGQLWEGGHRVPAIASWRGRITPGKVTHEAALTMDLFPTMAALAGARLPDGLRLDGVSLAPALEGGRLGQRTVFWRKGKAMVARRGPWKLLIDDGQEHLFNLDGDIGERQNLLAAQPARAEALRRELLAWEKEVTAGVKMIR